MQRTPIEKLAEWIGTGHWTSVAPQIAAFMLVVGAFLAFAFWLAGAPEGQAFNNWVQQ